MENKKSLVYHPEILKILDLYEEKTHSKAHESETIKRFKTFVKTEKNCFHRTNLAGHVTSSAVVANKDFTKVLFTYHAKLKRWLQLGGHCDGDSATHRVALKEAQEESGLCNFEFIDFLNFPSCAGERPIPYDIDIHLIPERKDEPQHYHYDLRYLVCADENEKTSISEESLDLKWISINEIDLYTKEASTLRLIKKIKFLLNRQRR